MNTKLFPQVIHLPSSFNPTKLNLNHIGSQDLSPIEVADLETCILYDLYLQAVHEHTQDAKRKIYLCGTVTYHWENKPGAVLLTYTGELDPSNKKDNSLKLSVNTTPLELIS